MKTNSLLILVMLLVLSLNSNAQLNYLFSATSRPYIPVTGGVSPALVSDFVDWEVEDEGFARIPIGFTFKYDGENYTMANVHVNGFITLKDSLNINFNYPYFMNNLRASPPYNKRPVIAAFWDDLLLASTSDLVYKTSGYAPFRVFTIEWKKAKWVYESPAPVLSIELKLYETTNIIEFHYKDEGGLPDPSNAFASIGITSSEANREFISLQNTSANPTISLVESNDGLSVKPANNQVYRFIPALVKSPASLHRSISYTNKRASFKLASGGPGFYEYALTRSPIPPVSGTVTFASNITVSSLSPATTYYIYARSTFFGLFNSQWVCDSFTTAVPPLALPYHLSGNPALYPYFPPDMRLQNFMDTSYFHYPESDADWNVVTDFPNFGDTSLYALNTLGGLNGDSWIFTPGFTLTAGKTYELKFGYMSFATQVPGEISSIEIKYGRATGEAGMTSGMLFKRDDIVTDFNADGSISFEDTTIEITPALSGVYYFGFHNLTTLYNGQVGPIPVIGNLSLAEKTVLPPPPIVLTGNRGNTGNLLNWIAKDNKTAGDFEIQRSTDGIHFTGIAEVPYGVINNKSERINHTTVKVNRTKEIPYTLNSKSKHSVVNNAHVPGIELQRTSNTTRDKKVAYKYTDITANGVSYYRLYQSGRNGKAIYSNIVMLKNDQQVNGLKFFPNPATKVLHVSLPQEAGNELALVITDVSGKTCINKSIAGLKGRLVELDISSLLPGTYFLKIICETGCKEGVSKFIKQ